jgi:ubiquinone/menaquinone biosynthesis C-methylase UbiE
MRRLSGAHELLDGPLDPAHLEGNLADLRRVNRWLDGAGATWRALRPLLAAHAGATPFRMIDVGTGGADIPLAVWRAGTRERYPIEIVATDSRAEVVAAARKAVVAVPAIAIELTGPAAIEAPDRAFDVAHASLLLHHLEPPRAVAMLREMARVSRAAVVVNDLDRKRRWWVGAWLMSHVLTGNRYTRNDAPLSVRRAYRPDEVVEMASRAGLREVARHWTRPGYRYALVFEHVAG